MMQIAPKIDYKNDRCRTEPDDKENTRFLDHLQLNKNQNQQFAKFEIEIRIEL